MVTPSIGIEQPGCVAYEPAFAIDVEWTLLDELARLGNLGGDSSYLRLSTRPVDQSLAGVALDPAARSRLVARSSPGATCCARIPRPPGYHARRHGSSDD